MKSTIISLEKEREALNAGKSVWKKVLTIAAGSLFLAGMALLTPGFLTDLCGLLILLPATRNIFKRWLRKKFDEWRQNPNVHITFHR